MSMTSFRFLIRDGLEKDINACLALDHSYHTENVWQMSVKQDSGQWEVMFKTERLPRSLEIDYPADEKRLRASLPSDQCFVVAVGRDDPEILGYLAMHLDRASGIALVQDVVVSRKFRRQHVGSRLMGIARQWAQEHDARQFMLQTQTKNYPGIQFAQAIGLTFCGFNDQYFENQDIAVFFGEPLR